MHWISCRVVSWSHRSFMFRYLLQWWKWHPANIAVLTPANCPPLQTLPAVGYSASSASSMMALFWPLPVISAAQSCWTADVPTMPLHQTSTVWMVAVQQASLNSAASCDYMSHLNSLVFIRHKFIYLFYLFLCLAFLLAYELFQETKYTGKFAFVQQKILPTFI